MSWLQLSISPREASGSQEHLYRMLGQVGDGGTHVGLAIPVRLAPWLRTVAWEIAS
jgi:hypothetical protein